jgi:RNA polymerase subunit RPABC4/transcription elongation factor Spt4
MQIDFEAIGLALQMLAMVTGAVLAAFWIGLVVWTAQDIRSRSRDLLTVLLSVLLVLVFNLLGLALYLLMRPKETLADAYERALEEETLLQGLENRGLCPNCQRPIEHDFVLCPVCRTRLKRPCHHCGRLLQPGWAVCPYCAEPVLASTEPAAAAAT